MKRMRQAIKKAVFGTSLLLTSPLIFAAWLERRVSVGESIFVFASQLLSLVPGLVGTYLRAAYYYASLECCAWEVHVGFGSIFTHRGASLAARASIGAYCVIGHAHIGQGVMMASRVSIPSGKRQHIDEAGRMSPVPRFDRVAVGEGVWVGEGAIIMADVGANSIVSAGTVVVEAVADASLVAGNPARVIRSLKCDARGILVS
jgi:virginiamycin A acetyltransferase